MVPKTLFDADSGAKVLFEKKATKKFEFQAFFIKFLLAYALVHCIIF